jgi:hypothetical protein
LAFRNELAGLREDEDRLAKVSLDEKADQYNLAWDQKILLLKASEQSGRHVADPVGIDLKKDLPSGWGKGPISDKDVRPIRNPHILYLPGNPLKVSLDRFSPSLLVLDEYLDRSLRGLSGRQWGNRKKKSLTFSITGFLDQAR